MAWGPAPPRALAITVTTDLRDAWSDLLRRRAALVPVLQAYTGIVDAWAAASDAVSPLAWSADECRRRWSRDVPVIAAAPPRLAAETLEAPLGAAMEAVAAASPHLADALQRLAAAWDRGDVTPAALLPSRGKIGDGVVEAASGLPAGAVEFLAAAALRPSLERYFAACAPVVRDGDWSLGVCPCCGAPAAWADLVDEGRRRLACHVCGTTWPFGRLRCPFCGNDTSADLVRLVPEDTREEGYAVAACRQCHAFIKEVDRRSRWNAGPPTVEDWGTPHLDVAAARQGYWRPIPTLPLLVKPA